MMPHTTRVDEALRRIRSEFAEMPGLRLTSKQARRLWGYDDEFCEAVLAALVDAKYLLRTGDGVFLRVEPGAPRRMTRRAMESVA